MVMTEFHMTNRGLIKLIYMLPILSWVSAEGYKSNKTFYLDDNGKQTLLCSRTAEMGQFFCTNLLQILLKISHLVT